jgi:hypothetical protein
MLSTLSPIFLIQWTSPLWAHLYEGVPLDLGPKCGPKTTLIIGQKSVAIHIWIRNKWTLIVKKDWQPEKGWSEVLPLNHSR